MRSEIVSKDLEKLIYKTWQKVAKIMGKDFLKISWIAKPK